MKLPSVTGDMAKNEIAKFKPKNNISLKGIGQMKQSVRSSGFAVPNEHGLGQPTIGEKKATEETYFDVLCKEAGYGSMIMKNLPGLAVAGTLGLGTMNAINSGTGFTPAFMGMAAMAPFAGVAAKGARKVIGRIGAGVKAEQYLTKDLRPHQLENGGNTLKHMGQRIENSKDTLAQNERFNHLSSKGKNLTEDETHEFNYLNQNRNMDAFHQKYNSGAKFNDMVNKGNWKGVASKAKGMALQGFGMVNENVRKDIVGGAYASQERIKPSIEATKDFVNNSGHIEKNIDYMKKNNINPESLTADIYNKGHNPDNFYNMDHEQFKSHGLVGKNNPNDKKSKARPFGISLKGRQEGNGFRASINSIQPVRGGTTLKEGLGRTLAGQDGPSLNAEHQYKL